MNKIKEYFYLFKIHHWIKNLSIFLPILTSHSYKDQNIFNCIVFFLIFSFLASIIYLFNNIKDYDDDRKNKKIRYSININNKKTYYLSGLCITSVLLIISFLIEPLLFLICLFYFLLALSYNFFFKNIKYLDILILGIFHLIRIYYGSTAFKIDLSFYFILFFLAIFLMIGSSKRLIELNKGFLNRPYRINDKNKLSILQIILSGIAVLTFLFYCLDPSNNKYFIYEEILFINLILIILILLNFLTSQKNANQDIVVFIYRDKINFFLVLTFFLVFVGNSNFFYN